MPPVTDRKAHFEERRDGDGRKLYCKKVDIGPDPASGRRRTRRVCAHTKKECLERVDDLKALRRQQADRGGILEPSKVTLADQIRVWLETLRETVDRPGGIRGATLFSYERVMNQWVIGDRHRIGKTQLRNLTPVMIEAFYRDMITEGMAPGSVRLVHTLLKMALDDATRLQVIPTNPARVARPPKKPTLTRSIWKPDETTTFLTAPPETTAHLIATHRLLLAPLRLMALTGMRNGEMRALTWEHVNLTGPSPSLRIVATVTRDQTGKASVGAPKTGSGVREVPLVPAAVALLRDHRVAQNQRRLAAGALWNDEGLVFDRGNGKYIASATISDAMKTICTAIGVPVIRVHDLRHTAITFLVMSGVDEKTVALMMGHSSVSVTLNTYVHPDADAIRRAAEVIGGLIPIPAAETA